MNRPEPSCRRIASALRTRGRLVARPGVPSPQQVSAPVPPQPSSAPVPPQPSLDAIRAHLGTCPACRARHGHRLAALEARDALTRRELPVDSFEGFYDEIRERAPFTAPGGGMSAAFLDAPRSLRLWRTAALAASLLLALGVGFAATGGVRPGGTPADSGARIRPLQDPRDRLLPTFDPTTAAWPVPSGFLVHSAHAPVTRGHEAFFEPAVAEPVLIEDGEGERDVRFR